MTRKIYRRGVKTPEYTYIYKLICPKTNEVKYVGKADNLDVRLTNHILEATSAYGSTRKDKWIRSLLNKGLEPKIEMIEQCQFNDYVDRERYWIHYYLKQGCKLVNQHSRRLKAEIYVNAAEHDIIKRAAKRYDLTTTRAIKLLVEYAANHLNLDTVYEELAQKDLEW